MKANPVDSYIANLTEDRKQAMEALRKTILDNLPKGFSEVISYGSIGYVVPHSLFPKGYHCDPTLPLPYINIASQKNFIAMYHMGLYGDPKLLEWFVTEYPKYSKTKLDMGKSCVRFKKIDLIPLKLIRELVKKVSLEDYIKKYESNIMSLSK